MNKKGIRLAAGILVACGFLYFFFRSADWKAVFEYLADVNIFFFALIVLLVPIHLMTRAARWHFLLKHEKKRIRFSNLFAANAVGFTVTNIFPGRLGELIKPLYLARKEGLRKGFCLGTVVVERIFDMFTMCALLGIFLLARPLYASAFDVAPKAAADLYFWGKAGVAVATAILLFSLALYFFREKTLRIMAFLLRLIPGRFSSKILELAQEFIDGLKFFHSVGNMLVYAAMSFVVWLGIVFYYWMMCFAFRLSVPFFLLVPYVFLTMVGASIPTPGMVGGFDYFSKLGLTSLYRIDPNLAVGMTIVIHAVQVVVTCLVGYVILAKEGLSLFQIRKIGDNENS